MSYYLLQSGNADISSGKLSDANIFSGICRNCCEFYWTSQIIANGPVKNLEQIHFWKPYFDSELVM
jgi:hypothetical protein